MNAFLNGYHLPSNLRDSYLQVLTNKADKREAYWESFQIPQRRINDFMTPELRRKKKEKMSLHLDGNRSLSVVLTRRNVGQRSERRKHYTRRGWTITTNLRHFFDNEEEDDVEICTSNLFSILPPTLCLSVWLCVCVSNRSAPQGLLYNWKK